MDNNIFKKSNLQVTVTLPYDNNYSNNITNNVLLNTKKDLLRVTNKFYMPLFRFGYAFSYFQCIVRFRFLVSVY